MSDLFLDETGDESCEKTKAPSTVSENLRNQDLIDTAGGSLSAGGKVQPAGCGKSLIVVKTS